MGGGDAAQSGFLIELIWEYNQNFRIEGASFIVD